MNESLTLKFTLLIHKRSTHYQDVFGWKFNKFEGGPMKYWVVTTGDDKEPGINGGMTRPREGQSPGTF